MEWQGWGSAPLRLSLAEGKIHGGGHANAPRASGFLRTPLSSKKLKGLNSKPSTVVGRQVFH